MKTVVVVSNTSWNIYNFRLNIIKALSNIGYRVVIVAPKDNYSSQLSSDYEYHELFMDNKGTNPLKDMKTLISFYNIYKRIKPDIILNYTIKPNIYSTIAGDMLGVKTINNISGLGTAFISENFTTRIVKWLYKYSQAKASQVFFQNLDDYNLFTEQKLVEPNKCDIIPGSGVDLTKFTPAPVTEKNTMKFLMIARILRDKGIYEYIDAVKIVKSKYHNIEFQLLGEIGVANQTAIDKEEVDNWVQEGIINYLGTTDNVAQIISDADCVVLPSYREGTPRSLLEACAMAKPIITTNVTGCKDIVEDGLNGYLCEVKNSVDLASKIETMINLSLKDRNKMGLYARKKIVNEYDENIVIKKYIESIKKIL